jgi:hypothetical protein
LINLLINLLIDLFDFFVFLRLRPPNDLTGGESVKKFNLGIDHTGDGDLVPTYSTSGEGTGGGLVPIYSTSGEGTGGDILFTADVNNGDAADTSL